VRVPDVPLAPSAPDCAPPPALDADASPPDVELLLASPPPDADESLPEVEPSGEPPLAVGSAVGELPVVPLSEPEGRPPVEPLSEPEGVPPDVPPLEPDELEPLSLPPPPELPLEPSEPPLLPPWLPPLDPSEPELPLLPPLDPPPPWVAQPAASSAPMAINGRMLFSFIGCPLRSLGGRRGHIVSPQEGP
jgi:hypothetical protein